MTGLVGRMPPPGIYSTVKEDGDAKIVRKYTQRSPPVIQPANPPIGRAKSGTGANGLGGGKSTSQF